MTAYYNEIDPHAAQWLRNLIDANLIAPGDVDERSIVDVRPSDLEGYTQCHFFAGIGVWSHSLRMAGWPDDRPVWTGSCPCQPFSAAGKGDGFDDERHLWPSFHHLIRVCRPPVFLGEQVEGKDGLSWLDLVQVDMENLGYACGAIVTPSAGVGAPHIRHRQRLVAQRLDDAAGTRREGREHEQGPAARGKPAGASSAFGMGDSIGPGLERHSRHVNGSSEPGRDDTYQGGPVAQASADGVMADTDGRNASPERKQRGGKHGLESQDGCVPGHGVPGPTNGFWGVTDWLFCRDGRWRPVRPGSFPLVNGASGRVGKLRAYGNAVDAEATKVFVQSVMDTIDH